MCRIRNRGEKETRILLKGLFINYHVMGVLGIKKLENKISLRKSINIEL